MSTAFVPDCPTAKAKQIQRRPRPAPIGVRAAAGVRGGRRGPFPLKKQFFWPFLASGVVRMGPDRRFGSFGLDFGPNGRFSTHFGPNLMFLDLTELWPMWPICPDGTRRALTEDSMDPYRCTTKIRTHTDPRRTPTGPNLGWKLGHWMQA